MPGILGTGLDLTGQNQMPRMPGQLPQQAQGPAQSQYARANFPLLPANPGSMFGGAQGSSGGGGGQGGPPWLSGSSQSFGQGNAPWWRQRPGMQPWGQMMQQQRPPPWLNQNMPWGQMAMQPQQQIGNWSDQLGQWAAGNYGQI